MKLFPGTLNGQLDEPYTLPKKIIRLKERRLAATFRVNIAPRSILEKSAFTLRADANEDGRSHHPRTVIEVATDVRFRDHFHLKDGDIVAIETLYK